MWGIVNHFEEVTFDAHEGKTTTRRLWMDLGLEVDANGEVDRLSVVAGDPGI